MTTVDEYWRAWDGEENTVPLPLEHWRERFSAPDSAYPHADFIPIDLTAVFTSYLDGEIDLYDPVNLESDDGSHVIATVAIGAAPEDEDLLFLFDTDSGEVLLLDMANPIPELVNSSLRDFSRFLYEFALFLDADQGVDGRAARAGELQQRLQNQDPAAFAESDSWWSMAFSELVTT